MRRFRKKEIISGNFGFGIIWDDISLESLDFKQITRARTALICTNDIKQERKEYLEYSQELHYAKSEPLHNVILES